MLSRSVPVDSPDSVHAISRSNRLLSSAASEVACDKGMRSMRAITNMSVEKARMRPGYKIGNGERCLTHSLSPDPECSMVAARETNGLTPHSEGSRLVRQPCPR